MEINKIDGYLDGGTIKIVTKNEIYCIDNRIRSNTKGFVYIGYPKDDNSNIISDQDSITNEILYSIKEYEDSTLDNFDWRGSIINFK